jgi:hypothetical protein
VQLHKDTVIGEIPNDHDLPPRRFAPGRVCQYGECGTRLSVYNKGLFCSLHAPSTAPRVRGKGRSISSSTLIVRERTGRR